MYLLFRHILLIGFSLSVLSVYSKTAVDVYEQTHKSIVYIESINFKGDVGSVGSGVIISNETVATNCHVIKDASQIKVTAGNNKLIAEIQYSDADRDVCSLKVAGLFGLPVVVGSTKTLKIGSKVFAVGAPKGLNLTISDGIVSSLREVEGGQYIQTTAAISPGSSGGGLFDENGALVGLTAFYITEGQNLNFAVPVEWVKELRFRSSRKASNYDSITQWINKSIYLENRKDWPSLLDHSLNWTKVQTSSEAAWFMLGRAYNEVGQAAKAIEAYQQAIRINQNNASTWFNIGSSYGDIGQSAESIDAYKKAILLKPEFAQAWNNMGATYNKMGQALNAINAYREAIKIQPEYGLAWFNLGNVYGKFGQHELAKDAYFQSIRINPTFPQAWTSLGNAFGRTGHLQEAVLAFNKSLEINPRDINALSNLGVAYSKLGQRDNVLNVYRQIKLIDPVYAERFFNANIK